MYTNRTLQKKYALMFYENYYRVGSITKFMNVRRYRTASRGTRKYRVGFTNFCMQNRILRKSLMGNDNRTPSVTKLRKKYGLR